MILLLIKEVELPLPSSASSAGFAPKSIGHNFHFCWFFRAALEVAIGQRDIPLFPAAAAGGAYVAHSRGSWHVGTCQSRNSSPLFQCCSYNCGNRPPPPPPPLSLPGLGFVASCRRDFSCVFGFLLFFIPLLLPLWIIKLHVILSWLDSTLICCAVFRI